MSKEDVIEAEGVVVEALPNANFSKSCPTATSLRRTFRQAEDDYIKILPGDTVL